MPKRKIAALVQVFASLFLLKEGFTAEIDPAKWEKDIAAFEAGDQTNPPPQGAVLFVGSSSIRDWKTLASDFPELKVINRGFGGSNLSDVTHYLERIVIPYHPSKIVLYGGDNDIGKGRSPAQVAADFRVFAEKVDQALPDTKLYFLAIKPSPLRWHLSPQAKEANRLIRRYSRWRNNVEFIDVWTPLLGRDGRPDPQLFEKDDLHINKVGYERWTRVVREALAD